MATWGGITLIVLEYIRDRCIFWEIKGYTMPILNLLLRITFTDLEYEQLETLRRLV
jgi:hypothetical protein